jgi:glycosyltransferase involved in cell wall biosynthesis
LSTGTKRYSKRVSIIIPCRNEEAFIGKVLENIISQDYPADLIEVFVADGISDDKSAEIINRYSEKYSFIRYLQNPQKVVPYALNKAIMLSAGEIIIRMDAHAVYPNNYVSMLVEGLEANKCENVGGVWITKPANESTKAKAIALATSHPFGIGNAYYRLSNQKAKEVDTVPFGCYTRSVFEKIGYFDEDLVRNQDDEFNARLIKNGGKIFLLPEIQIIYYAREKFRKVSKMFYQYGLYKPLVNLKIGKPATIRQFAPLMLVLFLVITGSLGLISNISLSLFLLIALLYSIACFLVAFFIWLKNPKYRGLIFYISFLFPLIHFSYGWGYLIGIFRFIVIKKPIHYSKMKENR